MSGRFKRQAKKRRDNPRFKFLALLLISCQVIPLGDAMEAVSINQSAAQVSRKFWRRLDDDTKRPLATLQFQNACGLAKTIPSFTLRQNLHGRFWEEIEKTLTKL